MYQNYPKTMSMSQVTEFQSKVYIRWRKRKIELGNNMKKLKPTPKRMKQAKTCISLDKFYLSLKTSKEKAPTATQLLNRHNINQQLAFNLRQGLPFSRNLCNLSAKHSTGTVHFYNKHLVLGRNLRQHTAMKQLSGLHTEMYSMLLPE